ncbi:hypothetical protein JOC95_002802 [Bacillus tianshenii]|uniref:Uncharacterized protein n=1 Tax=Sutcliffiella tianshenii TaxID=1463404 RepID=A0ABS2P1X7_9BACI|nr:hypothetical protein [Bacillus tianshenii]MBM7620947.1 hypothetical protein [Bacillus tianshenii]
MIKKSLIVMLLLIAFGASFYFIGSDMQVVDERYGKEEVIVWVLPLTLVLMNGNLLLFSRQKALQNYYARYKDGLESIFLSFTFLFFLFHIALLYTVSGNSFNLLTLVPLIVGFSLVATANTLPRFKLPEQSSRNEKVHSINQAWNKIIRPASYPMIIGGILMVASILLPEAMTLPVFFILLALTLISILIVSYKKVQSI